MTPARRKAEELVERFIGHPQLTDFGGMDDHIAIDCALICVEEVLRITDGFSDISGQITKRGSIDGNYTDAEHEHDYWHQVQTELKAMRDE